MGGQQEMAESRSPRPEPRKKGFSTERQCQARAAARVDCHPPGLCLTWRVRGVGRGLWVKAAVAV